jgi:hypothetical protein
MTYRTIAWFDRQLAHARECLAQADKIHTPEELAAARAALNLPPIEIQPELELRHVA